MEGFPCLDPVTQPFGGKGVSGGASPQHAWSHVLAPTPRMHGDSFKGL